MTFIRTLAGLVLLALAVGSANAQRGAPFAGRGGGTTLAVPSAGRPAQPSPSGARPSYLPAPVGVLPQAGPVALPHSAFSPANRPVPSSPSRFALQNAPATVWRGDAFRRGIPRAPRTFLGVGLGGVREYRRPFPHFPYFFFGGGPSACSPLLPGFFGSPWFDRQFTCFGTPFYGVNFYPEGFLAPQLAYEPWLQGLPQANEQLMYGPEYAALLAGNLDMIAGIAARESAESNPNQQVTTLVLKDGISFGVIDYWVNGDKLGYVTTYGRQNTIDLDRLDLQKTVNRNSMRGIPFVLQERANPPVPAAPPR